MEGKEMSVGLIALIVISSTFVYVLASRMIAGHLMYFLCSGIGKCSNRTSPCWEAKFWAVVFSLLGAPLFPIVLMYLAADKLVRGPKRSFAIGRERQALKP